jgi:hypothetical protein
MPPLLPSERPASASRSETQDPFAAQLRLSRMHTRLVPMQRIGLGYAIDPAAAGWFELPASRGFAGYGLARALGLLLDAMRGLSALSETVTEAGEVFAHGEFNPLHFRVDPLGVCRLVPLTARHYESEYVAPPRAALGFLSPERLIAEKVGLRADVFSAGVLLWEALAGRRLMEADRADVILERLFSRKIRVPPLPPQLAWATPLKAEVERALSVNQQHRFADCAEFSDVILRLVQDRVASHDEVAAFFRSNFDATVKMLPAVALGSATPRAARGDDSAPQRHTTLKMNVTLRMAHVPLPLFDDQPPPTAAASAAISAPTPTSTPAPSPISAPTPSLALPPLPASHLPRRMSPPPLPPAGRSSPPPLPPLPARPTRPPPLPSLTQAPRSSLPSQHLPVLMPAPVPEPTLPAPLMLEFEQPEADAGGPAAAATPDRGTTTPVPTQISFLHPSTVSSIAPTTTEAAPNPPSLARQNRSLPALVAVVVTLIAGATAALKITVSQATPTSTSSATTGVQRRIPAALGAPASTITDSPGHAAPADTLLSTEPNRGFAPPARAPELTPNSAHSIVPGLRMPSTRPAPSSTLPRGKDYGI